MRKKGHCLYLGDIHTETWGHWTKSCELPREVYPSGGRSRQKGARKALNWFREGGRETSPRERRMESELKFQIFGSKEGKV